MNLEKPDNLTVEDLAKILKGLPELKSWISEVESYALEQAQNGTDIPGFTLGNARAMRVWTDEVEVANILLEQEYDEEEVYPRSLLSVAQMEKLLGKEKFNSLLSTQVGEKVGSQKLIAVK